MAGGHRAGQGRGSGGFWGVRATPRVSRGVNVNVLALICCLCKKGCWKAASVPQEAAGCPGWGVRGKGPPERALGRCGEFSTASPAPDRAAWKPWGVHAGLSSAQPCAFLLSRGERVCRSSQAPVIVRLGLVSEPPRHLRWPSVKFRWAAPSKRVSKKRCCPAQLHAERCPEQERACVVRNPSDEPKGHKVDL